MWHASAGAAIVEDEDERSILERAEDVASAVLSGAQDAVAHALRDQWPPDGARGMALPNTVIVDDTIQMWYGARDAPAIILEPLGLAEFIE